MLELLKQQVCKANLELPRCGLVTHTWGNVSGIDRAGGLVVIKPSGVEYDVLTPEKMVVVDLQTGKTVEGSLNPSSDTQTHLELYRAFPGLGGIVHTHSPYAAAWAQAGQDIPCCGTTHADYFYGPVPCTRQLAPAELEEYEKNTGAVIVETFRTRGLDPAAVPAVLCRSHGPFAWGSTPAEAVYHASVLEEVAKMALFTRQVDPAAAPAPRHIVEKHYRRKHGPHAYYGQPRPEPSGR